jgi:hypothetical protein
MEIYEELGLIQVEPSDRHIEVLDDDEHIFLILEAINE